MAFMHTFQDPFISSALNTNLWTQFTAGSATMSYGNGVTVTYPASTTSSTDGDIISVSTYNMTGSYAMVNITSTANVGAQATTDNAFKVSTGGGLNLLTFLIEDSTLYAQKIVSGSQTNLTSIAYNARTHAWLRFRESGGTTYWETSPDGVSWNIFYSASNPIPVTALYVAISGTAWGAATSPGNFTWRYFNTPNSEGMFSHLRVGDGMSVSGVAN